MKRCICIFTLLVLVNGCCGKRLPPKSYFHVMLTNRNKKVKSITIYDEKCHGNSHFFENTKEKECLARIEKYDIDGNPVERRYFDRSGRETQMKEQKNVYNAARFPVSRADNNPSNGRESQKNEYIYDTNNRPVKQIHYSMNMEKFKKDSEHRFEYNSDGYLLKIYEKASADTDEVLVRENIYDKSMRLIEAKEKMGMIKYYYNSQNQICKTESGMITHEFTFNSKGLKSRKKMISDGKVWASERYEYTYY